MKGTKTFSLFIKRFIFWIILVFLMLVRLLSNQIGYSNGTKLRISGKVLTQPIYYTNSQFIKLSQIGFYLPKYPMVSYGDHIVVEGEYESTRLKDAMLIRLETGSGVLLSLRKAIVDFYKSTLSEPHSSLIAGVTLGYKSSLPKDFWDSLKKSGTAHVVVASGMNVTLVAGFLFSVLIVFFNRNLALMLALTGVWTYVSLSGFEAPLVRAAIMGSLAFSAQILGRLVTSLRTLFLSVTIMLILVPSWITDLGFILSFVASLSLILFEKKISRLISFVPAILRQDLSTTLAAQIGAAPIIYASFGQFNFLSPLANAFVLWTIPLITIVGGVAGVLGLLFPVLGRVLLWLTYPATFWFVNVIKYF